MNSVISLPIRLSMNKANNSNRTEDDRLAFDETTRRSMEIQQIYELQQQRSQAFLPSEMHIRRPSDTYYDTDSSDDLRAFPLKLHACLDNAESHGFDHIISWQSQSLFKIKDADAFEEHIMPQYFKSQSKYKSFQRQLNLYEFERVARGPFKGSYRHEFFKRGQHELSNRMRLRKIKGRNSGSSKAKKQAEKKAQRIPSPPQQAPAQPEASASQLREIQRPATPSDTSTPKSSTSSTTRRPRNRPMSQCTFEGRKFFPI